jgi:hypothetical protein
MTPGVLPTDENPRHREPHFGRTPAGWWSLAPLTGWNVDPLILTLRQRGLNFPPGEEWSSSNSGYVLRGNRGTYEWDVPPSRT